jgi:hypothetical protein
MELDILTGELATGQVANILRSEQRKRIMTKGRKVW